MPDLSEFLNKKKMDLKLKDRDLEQLGGVRPCAHCSEDVSGALWDAVDLTMYWKCNNGHENSFRVN